MSFLIDTNILIPLEPTSEADADVDTPRAAEFHRMARECGKSLFVHPEQKMDLNADGTESRKSLRLALFRKYQTLEHPPEPSGRLAEACGHPAPGVNDWVDMQLLAAVERDAVTFLVTHDKRLYRKARKSGIDSRILTLEEACSLLRKSLGVEPHPLPALKFDACHNLDLDDPLFDGFRSDYTEFDDCEVCRMPGFDPMLHANTAMRGPLRSPGAGAKPELPVCKSFPCHSQCTKVNGVGQRCYNSDILIFSLVMLSTIS